jgi:glutamate--cysteine ligase
MMLAQSAFWTGIFYDQAALSAAVELTKGISYETLLALRAEVPRSGLNTAFRSGNLRGLARDAVAIAEQGLKARAMLHEDGGDERRYLAPLQEIAAGGPTQAEHWLSRYHGAWKGDVSRVFDEAAL